MNKAVDTKLKNPKMPLFDALRLGGFHYPRNVDAATMDNDHVTLGQRKNQLNRRLRLARKNLLRGAAANKEGSQTSSPQTKSAAVKLPVGGLSPLVIAGSYLRRKPKRSAATTLEKVTVKKVCHTNTTTTNKASPRAAPTAVTLHESSNASRSHSHALVSHTPTHRVGVTADVPDTSLTAMLANPTIVVADRHHQDLNWWPTTIPVTVNHTTPAEHNHTASTPTLASTASVHNNMPPSPQLLELMAGTQQTSRMTSHHSSSTNSLASATTTSSNATTSSSSHSYNEATAPWHQDPPPPLAAKKSPRSEEEDRRRPNNKKEQLALQYVRAGLPTLYQQSMRAAGFRSDQVHESSPSYHDFLLQAWKQERERLQAVVRHPPDDDDDDLVLLLQHDKEPNPGCLP